MLHTAWLVVFTVENSSAAHRSSRSSAPSTVSRMVSHCLAIGGGESDWPTADPIKASSTRQLRYFIIKVITCWLADLLAGRSVFLLVSMRLYTPQDITSHAYIQRRSKHHYR